MTAIDSPNPPIAESSSAELRRFFPQLTTRELEQLERLAGQYRFWNSRVNLISRHDIPYLYTRHLAHALTIRHLVHFDSGEQLLDLGTGAGLPGLPLAITCPEQQFTLVDSKLKKIQIVKQIIADLGLPNVHAVCERAENLSLRFDRVLCRGVADLRTLYKWSRPLLLDCGAAQSLLCLKGGVTLQREIQQSGLQPSLDCIHPLIPIPYFAQRYLVSLPARAKNTL